MQFVYEPIKTLIECCMADNRTELWKLTDRLGVTPKLKSCAPVPVPTQWPSNMQIYACSYVCSEAVRVGWQLLWTLL